MKAKKEKAFPTPEEYKAGQMYLKLITNNKEFMDQISFILKHRRNMLVN